MIQPEGVLPPPAPRNGAGRAALALGVVSIVFVLVPIVGDFVSLPAAVGAVVTGYVGFVRAEDGVATNRGEAAIGGGLGVLTLMLTLIMFAAMHGATST